MAYAITQSCCADASCVSACPVNCIHPTPDEPGFGTTDQLFIDPVTCIDCGACADACPVDAAKPADQLTRSLVAYIERNQEYFNGPVPSGPTPGDAAPVQYPRSLPASVGQLRIAVVGTGPSAGYTVRELLRSTDAKITVIDRNPVAGGLVRFGVAPDHVATKRIGDSFARAFRHPRVSMRLGVEVGRDTTHEDLLRRHHAVIYATGADIPRDLGIPGEDLQGSIAATEFLGWCNGRPGISPTSISLDAGSPDTGSADTGSADTGTRCTGSADTGSADTGTRCTGSADTGSAGHARRAVVIGNGNVAIDVARLLLSDDSRLDGTAIAPHARAALRGSAVSEVVLVARRGPADAAFAPKEFIGLRQLPGLEIVIDGDPGVAGEIATAEPQSGSALSPAALLREVPVKDVDWAVLPAGPPTGPSAGPSAGPPTGPPAGPPAGKRLVLRFYSAPVEARGDGRVETVRVSDRNTGTRDIPAGLLVRSIGSRGAAIPGLPFDDATGIIPNTGGRISPGSYVVGWAKRGSSGGIGANRACAAETVGALFDDIVAGRLPVPGANTGKSSTGKSRSGKPGAGKPGTGKFARLTRSRSRSLARS